MNFKLSTMYSVGVVFEVVLAIVSLAFGHYEQGFLCIVIMNQFTILQRMAEDRERCQSLYDFVGLLIHNLEQEMKEAQE